MFDTLIGKYRNIVVSIALFLLLDASVLMLNFYISFEISEDASGVNLAGRQRMLSQRMVKSLLDTQYLLEEGQQAHDPIEELKTTVFLFDSTLKAFDLGGVAKGASGQAVELAPVSTQAAITSLIDAKRIWGPYKQRLDSVVNTPDDLSFVLPDAIAYARANNLTLLRLMNDLTVELERVATSKATRLRLIQTVGITLAIINFFIILFHFLRQLKESDKKLDDARKETTEILETVNEGLFLLDKDYKIGSQYSLALEDMFVRKDIAGLSFESLLGDIVSSKNLNTSERFIALLFRQEIKGNLIGDLNPLKEVEVNISDDNGKFVNKFLSFSFERVYEGSDIKDVLVTVTDVTERVTLERELALTREQSDRQIEVLTNILHANPDMLNVYLEHVFSSINKINNVLREPAKTSSAFRRKLEEVFVSIHSLKGEASALGLESFTELTHEFEKNIIDIRDMETISGDDFLPLVVRLEKLVKHAEMVQALADRLAGFSVRRQDDPNEPANQTPSGLQGETQNRFVEGAEWTHLSKLSNEVAARCGKKVLLVTSGLSEVVLDERLKSIVNDLSIQCIRNAIAHGIELPDERGELGKIQEGRIDIRLARVGSEQIELSIRDDGYGIDVDRVREAAIQSGRWSETELEGWDSKRIMSLIFESGFSSTEEHNIDAGSGVGMDVIKQRVNEMRGKIRVRSRKGIGTRISVYFPCAVSDQAAA